MANDSEATWTGRFRRHKWLLLATSVWAARMAAATIAIAIPFCIEVYYELSARAKIAPEHLQLRDVPWTPDLSALFDAEEESIPKVIRHAPVPTMDQFLDLLPTLNPDFTNVKMNDLSRVFLYHASDRAWGVKLNISSANYDTAILPILHVIEHIYAVEDMKPYYYVSYDIKHAFKSPIVAASAPYLLRIGGHALAQPQMRLWLGSNGATASWHYDMESNFFVQLTGSKVFLLANADAYLFLNPQSFLHPNWRQSVHFNLTSIASVIDVALSFLDAQSNISCFGRQTTLHNHNRLNPICKFKEMQESATRTREKIVVDLFGLQEVSLAPGDVLHLPPFYFHCVISGKNSSSLNAWLGSKELSISQKLQTVPLPFMESDSFIMKLTAVRFTIMRLFTMFGQGGASGIEFKMFSDALRERYRGIVENSCDENSALHVESAACRTDTCAQNRTNDLISACSWNLSPSDLAEMETGRDHCNDIFGTTNNWILQNNRLQQNGQENGINDKCLH